MTGPEASRTIDALVDELAADMADVARAALIQQRMLETWLYSEAYASRAARAEWFATWRQLLAALGGRTGADASSIALAQTWLTWAEAHVLELLGEAP
jgi:hypothetical protein